MALPVAAKAAKLAHDAWRNRERLGPLLLVPIIVIAAAISVPTMFVSFALGTAGQAEQVCLTTATEPSDADAVRRAARRRGADAPAAAVLAAFSSAAQATYPTDTLDRAGLFRLPVDYADGEPGDPGRWQGPTDPLGLNANRDSRRSVAAATRAVMRKLTRTDPSAWTVLRTAPATMDADTVEQLTASARDLLTRAFPDVSVDEDALRQAIMAAALVDAGGYGDQITGGVLIIGDLAQVTTARDQIGPRAFGGVVRARPTSTDPATITTGADRALAAQDGVVIAITTTPPTLEQIQDTQDSTNADVIWVTPGATGTGIYPTLDAAIGYLSSLSGASAPVGLCQQVLFTTDVPIDLSAISAPDAGSFTAIAYAQSMVGRPYSTAATPPTSWDCSKLTAAAWAQAGVKLTAYSYTQYEQTTRIPESMVAPGDIAFWFGTNGASGGHVALVDQVDPDGTVWITEAANPTDGVRRRALGGSWDDAYFTGFGRVTRPGTPAVTANSPATSTPTTTATNATAVTPWASTRT